MEEYTETASEGGRSKSQRGAVLERIEKDEIAKPQGWNVFRTVWLGPRANYRFASLGTPVTAWKSAYLICINASLSALVIKPSGCESTKRKTLSHASSASVAGTGSLWRYSGEGDMGGNGG